MIISEVLLIVYFYWHSLSETVTVTAAAGINLRGTSSEDTTNPTNLGVLALLGRGQQVKFDHVLV